MIAFCSRLCAALPLIALLAGGGPAFGHDGHDHGKAAKKESAAGENRPARQAARKSRSRWGANHFPNVVLTSHEGKKVRFFDDLLKDKVVMVNFIYTTCPDVCSVETARLMNVKQILGDRVGKDIFMYSITIDPKVDTPEVLKNYREKFGIGPGWSFYTGSEEDILLLRKRMGLYIEGIDKAGPTNDHNVSLVIGNQTTGRWMKRSPFDDPYFLASQVGSWLTNWRRPDAANRNSYADAPKLRNTSMGENLYRTRCSSCHTIGAGVESKVVERRLGPDLYGVVAKRDRAWLARWLAEPDKMLAEKDPIAMELLAEYNNMPMPSLRLSKREVDALIEFMGEEDKRLDKVQQSASSKQGEKKVDGRFALVDSKGRKVTDETFRGKWMMVFFGYTFCPDVCPTALNDIAVTMNLLGPLAKQVQPIFISIDPKRDTPEVLAEYTAAFDERILGLTGSPEQVAAASRSYNAFYKKVGESEDYLMDHTAAVYLIGPDGKFVARFNHQAGTDPMVAKLKDAMARAKKGT